MPDPKPEVPLHLGRQCLGGIDLIGIVIDMRVEIVDRRFGWNRLVLRFLDWPSVSNYNRDTT